MSLSCPTGELWGVYCEDFRENYPCYMLPHSTKHTLYLQLKSLTKSYSLLSGDILWSPGLQYVWSPALTWAVCQYPGILSRWSISKSYWTQPGDEIYISVNFTANSLKNTSKNIYIHMKNIHTIQFSLIFSAKQHTYRGVRDEWPFLLYFGNITFVMRLSACWSIDW